MDMTLQSASDIDGPALKVVSTELAYAGSND